MPAALAKSKTARQEKPTAFFRVAYEQESIDKALGILRGVKLMELGKLAKFAGPDGKAKAITITAAHISALLGHAGNRAIPIHFTHDWFAAQGKEDADTVEMQARIGALKQIRKDTDGNLIADAYLKEGDTRTDIIFGAEHNPEDNCFSVVFSYDPEDKLCIPLNFRAGDIVPQGAATTALFSETKTNNEQPMDDKDFMAQLTAALSDATFKSALLAAMQPEAKKDDEKKEDAFDSAKFKADLTAEFETKKTALLAEVETKAQAAATALLGKGGFSQASGTQAPDVEAKLSAIMAAGAPNRGVAIMRFAHDKPEEYNAARAAGKL